MAEVQSLSHSAICVHDLKEAEDFYCGILGAHPHAGVNFITEDTIKGRSVHKSVMLEDYLIALALAGDFMPMPAEGKLRGAHGFRVSQLCGDLSIAARLTERNGQKGLPHLFLECGSGEIQGQGELPALAGKIFAELTFGFPQHRMALVFQNDIQAHPFWIVIFPENRRQSRIAGDEFETADRRWHGGINILVCFGHLCLQYCPEQT